MKRILIVGAETIVGGNLALALAPAHQVVGLTSTKPLQIAGCQILHSVPKSKEGIQRELAKTSPDLVVICGAAARPTWSWDNSEAFDLKELETAVAWARETAQTKARLIVVSSDAVFHGPWMFHEEDCTGLCQSAVASAIRDMETQVLRACPQALIARTNVFGWSPEPSGGWLESLLEQIASKSLLRVPSVNYATPIEASQFVEILIGAWDRGLEGIYHIGGSERVNFMHFAHRLAQEFQLPRPTFQSPPQSTETHTFGQGETSLSSNRLRRAIARPLPLLAESLVRLREHSETGERDGLHGEPLTLVGHAA